MMVCRHLKVRGWFRSDWVTTLFTAPASVSLWIPRCLELTGSSHSTRTAHALRLQVTSSWLTRFHERVRSASWAGARGSYGHPARAACTRSRRRCDTWRMAQQSAGPQYSAASCTPTDTRARGTRLYSGPASLLQKEKQKEWKWWGVSQAGVTQLRCNIENTGDCQ